MQQGMSTLQRRIELSCTLHRSVPKVGSKITPFCGHSLWTVPEDASEGEVHALLHAVEPAQVGHDEDEHHHVAHAEHPLKGKVS